MEETSGLNTQVKSPLVKANPEQHLVKLVLQTLYSVVTSVSILKNKPSGTSSAKLERLHPCVSLWEKMAELVVSVMLNLKTQLMQLMQ